MPKRWVVGGIWAVLMSAVLLACSRNAAAEQPAKSGKILITDVNITSCVRNAQMVRKVTFLGAKHIKSEELQNITGVRPSTPLDSNLNRRGCLKILKKYAEQGRSLTECYLIKGGDLADTEVVYQITEGPKVKVGDIKFEGDFDIDSGFKPGDYLDQSKIARDTKVLMDYMGASGIDARGANRR